MAERVVVAMSGGVDSSLAAALLVEQGYDVIGVMLRLWTDAACGAAANKCCTTEAVADAGAVAARLNIPFYVVNAERCFKEMVVDAFVAQHRMGVTPNPCLSCNRHVRFGYLLRYACSLKARYLATGHYAQVVVGASGLRQLRRGVDKGKDQSYVLHMLGQDALEHVLFPLGQYTKPMVRQMARQRGLPTASRADSQDLCFVVDGDFRKFLTTWAPDMLRPGPIVDTEGRQLGEHRGLAFHTIGQRRGLGIGGGVPLYVLWLDAEKNALVVGPASKLGSKMLTLEKVNWVAGSPPPKQLRADVQIRYHAVPQAAAVIPVGNDRATVEFDQPVRDAAPGQAAVFFLDDVCLGGGLIERVAHG